MNIVNSHRKSGLHLIAAYLMLALSISHADGVAIDKVYHPYVQPLEQELEFRWLYFDRPNNESNQVYRLGYGRSLNENWFLEAYAISSDNTNDFKVDAYEIEAKVQLTEQGEFDADWGALFELGKATDHDIWELGAMILIESEWNKNVLTTNLGLSLEAGTDIQSEFETSLAMQYRYRYVQVFEPALELYLAQDTFGLGPVILGDIKYGTAKRLHWEFGVIAGLSDETPDSTLRALLEFEF